MSEVNKNNILNEIRKFRKGHEPEEEKSFLLVESFVKGGGSLENEEITKLLGREIQKAMYDEGFILEQEDAATASKCLFYFLEKANEYAQAIPVDLVTNFDPEQIRQTAYGASDIDAAENAVIEAFIDEFGHNLLIPGMMQLAQMPPEALQEFMIKHKLTSPEHQGAIARFLEASSDPEKAETMISAFPSSSAAQRTGEFAGTEAVPTRGYFTEEETGVRKPYDLRSFIEGAPSPDVGQANARFLEEMAGAMPDFSGIAKEHSKLIRSPEKLEMLQGLINALTQGEGIQKSLTLDEIKQRQDAEIISEVEYFLRDLCKAVVSSTTKMLKSVYSVDPKYLKTGELTYHPFHVLAHQKDDAPTGCFDMSIAKGQVHPALEQHLEKFHGENYVPHYHSPEGGELVRKARTRDEEIMPYSDLHLLLHRKDHLRFKKADPYEASSFDTSRIEEGMTYNQQIITKPLAAHLKSSHGDCYVPHNIILPMVGADPTFEFRKSYRTLDEIPPGTFESVFLPFIEKGDSKKRPPGAVTEEGHGHDFVEKIDKMTKRLENTRPKKIKQDKPVLKGVREVTKGQRTLSNRTMDIFLKLVEQTVAQRAASEAKKNSVPDEGEKVEKAAKKKPKLGSGERFKEVEEAARRSGAEDPEAVAAAVGIKKYGKKKMAELARAGKKKHKKK